MRKPSLFNKALDDDGDEVLRDFLENILPYKELEQLMEDYNITKFSMEITKEEDEPLEITSIDINV